MKYLVIVLCLLSLFCEAADVSETATIDVTIQDSTSIEFTDLSLTNSDFSFESVDCCYDYEGSSPWYYQSNERDGRYKVVGRVSEAATPGWSCSCILDPPEDAQGVFGTSANGGNYIELTTSDQDFVVRIAKGRVGNNQNQHMRIRITQEAWNAASGRETILVAMWTLSSE